MKILRLGTSNDFAGAMNDADRAWKIAENRLAEACGEPCETVMKRISPGAGLGPALDRWMHDLSPDMVVLQVNNYWYGHESAPLWLERKLGRPGRSLSAGAERLGRWHWIADRRWAQFINRRILAVLPKATHFTIPEVAASMEAAMRRVLAREGTVLLVRGNEDWEKMPLASERFNRRNRARNAAMHQAMSAVCERLHVPYLQPPPVPAGALHTVGGAGWHNDVEGERRAGELEGEAMVAAWQASLGQSSAPASGAAPVSSR